MPPEPLGILLLDGGFERAHYAFMLAAGAGAVGRRVVLFATNRACFALCDDWSGLADAGLDDLYRGRGVAGLTELRDAAAELGAILMACDSGMRIAGLEPTALLAGVTVAGIPTFLSTVGGGQLLSL